ncbi:MAG: PQQ-binding-like beta-propeller repeat protein, partial [Acidobacteriota bacterium]
MRMCNPLIIVRRGRRSAPAILALTFLCFVASCGNPIDGSPPENCSSSIGDVCQLWQVPGGSSTGLYVPATDGERFYAESPEGLTAYDVHSGEVAWSRRLDTETGPSSYVARDGRVFAVGMVAVALRTTDGEVLWRYPL